MMEEMSNRPEAYAQMKGDSMHPEIQGMVYFFGVYGGTLVVAEVYGLPITEDMENGDFYGFHIHEGNSCTGDAQDQFKNAGMHYNPQNKEHPKHAGDLPPLLGNNGMALSAVYTDRFYPEEVVGRTVIIHNMADDFKTQPSGDAGSKMVCGEIVATEPE